MKLVAKVFNSRFPDNFPNGIYDVTEYSGDTKRVWVYNKTDDATTLFNIDSNDKDCEASVHISTGMTDKNGQEILVGDEVIKPSKCSSFVIFDGTNMRLDNSAKNLLTPELAATLEVIE